MQVSYFETGRYQAAADIPERRYDVRFALFVSILPCRPVADGGRLRNVFGVVRKSWLADTFRPDKFGLTQ